MSFDPTSALVGRCQAWLKVVDTFEKYLVAAATRYDWIQEATSRLSSEMPQPEDLGDQFAPAGSGGIKDIFVKLWWDLNLPDGKAAESASKIIKEDLLKEVEALKKDLHQSIASFNEMSGTFGEGLAPSKTASLRDPRLNAKIEEYVRAVAAAESGKQPEVDPYVLKLDLDRKIDRVVRKHNTQADRFTYVQDDAKRLDADISERVQNLIRRYTEIAERNGRIIAGGALAVRSVFVNQPKLFEYKHWIQSSKAPATFSGTTGDAVKTRKSDNDLGYPKEDSVFSKAVRVGSLERRTKILRTYSPGDYVLTPQSLIEIRQNRPVWSIDLIGATLLENHKASNDDQFVIQAKQHGSSSGSYHKFVFRAKVPANWKRDIGAICAGAIPPSLADVARAQGSARSNSDEPPVIAGKSPILAGQTAQPQGKAADKPYEGTAADKPYEGTAADKPYEGKAADKPSDATAASPPQEEAAVQQFSKLSVQEPQPTAVAIAEPTPKPEPAVAFSQVTPDSEKDRVSVVDSNAAATGITPMSGTPLTGTPVKEGPPSTPAAATAVGSDRAFNAEDDDDSDVSDVTESYVGLADDEPQDAPDKYTLAGKAKEDMALFEKPVGSAALEGNNEQTRAALTGDNDNDSVWSYDAKNKNEASTFKNDANFKPTDADLPVEVERQMSNTSHKYESPDHLVTRDHTDSTDTPEQALHRRRSSVAVGSQKRKNSRKATGSYGGEEASALKPLSALTPADKAEAIKKSEESPLFFSEGLPSTTTGGDINPKH